MKNTFWGRPWFLFVMFTMFASPSPHVPSKMLSRQTCQETTPPTCCHRRGWGERQGKAGEVDCFAAVASGASVAAVAAAAAAARGWGATLLPVPWLKAFSISLPPPPPPSLSCRPSVSAQAPRGASLAEGLTALGEQGTCFLHPSSVRRASFADAWCPVGTDVKRWWSTAYRRLTWTLLHTHFLHRPLPLACTWALALYKRRERGVPPQLRLSAPWRAPVFVR